MDRHAGRDDDTAMVPYVRLSCFSLDDEAHLDETDRLETLEDGSIIIVGGCDFGGYVNDAGQNNPTFEYYPSRGAPIGLNLLCVSSASSRRFVMLTRDEQRVDPARQPLPSHLAATEWQPLHQRKVRRLLSPREVDCS